MTTTFETAKVGDRVWSLESGWGVINRTSHTPTHPILVAFASGQKAAYKLNGSRMHCYEIQTLFWGEVKIEAPPKPLPDLEVDAKVLVWVDSDRKHSRHFSHFSDGKIYTFIKGRTSFTRLDADAVTSWPNWELAE